MSQEVDLGGWDAVIDAWTLNPTPPSVLKMECREDALACASEWGLCNSYRVCSFVSGRVCI